MNCLEFRQLKLSDPYTINSEANAHRGTCAACAKFEEEIRGLDRLVDNALTVAVPENLAAKILLNHSLQKQARLPTRLYWLGAAASFLLVLVITFATTERATATALARAVSDHLDFEKAILTNVDKTPISEEMLSSVLTSVNAKLDATSDNIVYAKVCVINGQLIAHLVVTDGDEQFTVLVMPETGMSEMPVLDSGTKGRFTIESWRGIITQSRGVTVAVVSDMLADEATLERVSNTYKSAFKPAQQEPKV